MKFKHLPHLNLDNHYQFITFRTHDSTDPFLKKLAAQKINNRKKQMSIDDHLDHSNIGCYLNGSCQNYLAEYIKDKDSELFELVAFCIMPNHVHILCKPLVHLSKMMKQIKGVTAKRINELLEKKGKFWSSDYYDKAIRDEDHFRIVYRYIKNNPLKLVVKEAASEHSQRFYGIYE